MPNVTRQQTIDVLGTDRVRAVDDVVSREGESRVVHAQLDKPVDEQHGRIITTQVMIEADRGGHPVLQDDGLGFFRGTNNHPVWGRGLADVVDEKLVSHGEIIL